MPEIISRKEAIARGLKRYFNGKRCPKRHRVERFASNGKCVECGRIEIVKWRLTNKLKMRASEKIWRKKNRVRLKAYDRNRRAKNPEYYREIQRKAYRRNPGKFRLRNDEWLKKNPDRCKEYSRRYAASAKGREVAKRHRDKNREEKNRRSQLAYRANLVENRKKCLKRYYTGPSNPIGEKSWLVKAQAIRRAARRIFRNRHRAATILPEMPT